MKNQQLTLDRRDENRQSSKSLPQFFNLRPSLGRFLEEGVPKGWTFRPEG